MGSDARDRMIQKAVGKYKTYVLENEDMVVVAGDVAKHANFLKEVGLEEYPETKEWVGTGADLYRMEPSAFFDRFGSRTGGDPELTAQATDGRSFYQVDPLPLVEEDEQGRPFIVSIHALDLETRTVIEEGVSNFRVG